METTVQTKDEIRERLNDLRSDLRRLGVKRLGLFGSFLADAQCEESDVDLLVEFEPGKKSFDRFMQLSFLLEKALRRRVELVTREGLSPHLAPHILREVAYVEVAD